jgi:putative ABC transport system permease protein
MPWFASGSSLLQRGGRRCKAKAAAGSARAFCRTSMANVSYEWLVTFMTESIGRDLRGAIRTLSARPGWTAAAILCLAIATGANTAAFTLVNGLLLRPLPFDEPDRLVMVAIRERSATRPFSLQEFQAVSAGAAPTIQLLARTYFPSSVAAADGARMAQVELVSASYFETLRVRPFLGRFFNESDDREQQAPVAILSHRLWQLRFGGRDTAVGETIRINGRPVVIAGVAPPGFVGAMQLIAADVWLPSSMYAALSGSSTARSVPTFGVMGRLADMVTASEAQERLSALVANVISARDGSSRPAAAVTAAAGFGVPVSVQGSIMALSGFIYGMMTLLMAVACANVAALVLARGSGRRREIAVRLSLGASRWHIARQLLTESLVLAVAGCAAGAIVAVWLTQALIARLTTPFQYVNYAIDVHPDARVLAYAALATAAAAVLCGLAPIRYAHRVDVVDVIKESSSTGGSVASKRTLNAVVAMQFAVSTMLLAGATTLIRTYVNAQAPRPGFDTSGLIAATLDLDQLQLDAAAGPRVYQAIVERLAAVPGAGDVALTSDVPPGPGRSVNVRSDGFARASDPVAAGQTAVSAHYFQTLGLAIREGRSFHAAEAAQPAVAVINDAMARRLWPAGSAVGKTFTVNGSGAPIEVIGVVANATGDDNGRAQPAFYRPLSQDYSARMTAIARLRGDEATGFGEIRRAVERVNQDLSILDLRSIDDLLESRAAQRRVPATAFSVVSSLGLLLSAVGLYGVVAYSVRERARELGIRLALGARPVDVRRIIVRQGFTIVGVGLAIGTAATLLFTQIIRSSLFGVGLLDPMTFGAVAGILIAAAWTALYLPARWASTLDPALTLRQE